MPWSWLGDVRVMAVGLAVAGISGGLWLPLSAIIVITALIVMTVAILLRLIMAVPSYGTSGNLGLAIVVLGSAICFEIPMWVTYAVRWLMA